MASDYRDHLVASQFFSNSFLGKSEAGLLKSNRFIVVLESIPALVSDAIENLDIDLGTNNFSDLSWNAVSVSCPNISMDVGSMEIAQRPRYHFKTRADSDLSITFMETPKLDVRRFFNSWINVGFNVRNKGRHYPSEYTANQISVIPLAQDGQNWSKDVFIDVFPYEINNLDYSHFNEDVLLRTDVRFKFRVHDVLSFNENIGSITP